MANRSCGKWWQARTNLEKTLISFSIILFLTCVIIILVGVAHHGGASKDEEDDNICNTKSCIETAGRIMSMADFNVDPCHDFYEYSCGKYIKKHAAPLDYPEASVEHESADEIQLQLKSWLESSSGNNISVNRKVKTMFSTCMNHDQSMEESLSLLQKAFEDEKIGSWPILDHLWTEPDVPMEQTLASLTLLGIPVVFQLQVVPDRNNTGKYITKLSPGTPLFELHDVHDLRSDPLFQYVESVLLLLGVLKTRTASKVDDILSTEAEIMRLRENADKQCGDKTSLTGDLVDIRMDRFQEMSNQMHTYVDWTQLLANIYSVLNSSSFEQFPVELYCKRHIRAFTDFFDAHSKNIHTYMGWRFLSSIMEFLGPKFYHLHMDYKRFISKVEGPVVHLPRWKVCLSLTEQHMLPVLLHAYREQELDDTILNQKMKMAENLRNSLSGQFSSATWLKDSHKQQIMQKVTNSRFELPLSKISSDIHRLDKWFSDLNLQNDHLMLNMLRLKKFNVVKELKKLLDPPEEYLQWKQSSFTSAEYANHKDSHIAVHFDKLRSPYLNTKHQSYLNYGAFGTFLARELNRYLVASDSNNVNVTFWDAYLQTNAGTRCLFADLDTTAVDSESHNKEDYKDVLTELSSIRAAYTAYKKQKIDENVLPGLDLTEDQLFFLSYAQTMCEVQERHKTFSNSHKKFSSKMSVNMALQNLEDFSTAYSCTKGSSMSLTEKCQIWK